MIGDPYTIPYTEDFSTNDNVLSFLIEDTNSDGKTWEYMYDEGYIRIYNNDTPKTIGSLPLHSTRKRESL